MKSKRNLFCFILKIENKLNPFFRFANFDNNDFEIETHNKDSKLHFKVGHDEFSHWIISVRFFIKFLQSLYFNSFFSRLGRCRLEHTGQKSTTMW